MGLLLQLELCGLLELFEYVARNGVKMKTIKSEIAEVIHNMVAHPLLSVARLTFVPVFSRWAEMFHDYTAKHM